MGRLQVSPSLFELKQGHTGKEGPAPEGGSSDAPPTRCVSEAEGCLTSVMKADVRVCPESTNGRPHPKREAAR